MKFSNSQKIMLGYLLVVTLKANALIGPLSPLSTEPPRPTPLGTTSTIENDWNASVSPFSNEPDHSYRMIWVRMFPLMSVPLGDPYPQTQNTNQLEISNTNGLQVLSLAQKVEIAAGKKVKFDFQAGVMKVDDHELRLEPVWVRPTTETLTQIEWDRGLKKPDGKLADVRVRVRGSFVIKPTLHNPRVFNEDQNENPAAKAMTLWSAINVLPVNDYLRSVVPSEVYKNWHRETLRTQAIAARTYALYEMAQSREQNQDYDVDPSTWYQSYKGVVFWDAPSSTWRQVELSGTTAAIKHTRGHVILHGGEVVKAYFSANSGGRTCLVTECFGLPQNPPYIYETNDHTAIRLQPGGTWGKKAELTPAKVGDVLKTLGLPTPTAFDHLEALEQGPSGRTWRLRVHFKDKSSIDLDRAQTRKVMKLFGPIRSFLYTLLATDKNGRQAIRGHGYGHGVGMSQWGAQLYARSGWNAERILEHFYRQVAIKDLIFNTESSH